MKNKIAACAAGLLMMGGATAFAAIPGEAIALGGIAPGMSIDEAVAAFGTPKYQNHGEEAYFSNGVKIELDDFTKKTVEELKISRQGDKSVATPAGVAIGSPERAVTEAYGQPDKRKQDEGKTEYTYYATDGGRKLIIETARGSVVKIECELR